MTFYPSALGVAGIRYALSGCPPIKSELENSIYTLTKKGNDLEFLVQTPSIGSLETKLKKDFLGEYDLDEMNYLGRASKLPVYTNNATTVPSAASSSFDYSIVAKKNGFDATIRIFSFGKMKTSVRKNKKGDYEIRSTSFYDKHRTKIFSYKHPR